MRTPNVNTMFQNRAAQPALAALACLLLALFAVSCGATAGSAPVPQPPAVENPAVPAVPADQPQGIDLPSVESLRTASAAGLGRHARGGEAVPGLTSGNSAIGANSVFFEPQWNGTDSFAPAWAGFALDLSGYTGGAQLRIGMEYLGGPEDPELYFGLANWERGTWQWFVGDMDEAILLDSFTPYLRPSDDHVVAVILLLGTDAAGLDWIRAGDPIAPTAVIGADVTAGPAPLKVRFNTMGTEDPDSGYLMSISVDNGPFVNVGSFHEHTYQAPGTYEARLKVASHDGMEAIATVPITVDGYRPVARLTATPSIGQPGQMVSFNAAGSADQGGGIVGYSWDVDGDGSDDTGGPAMTTLSHQFMSVGTYHPRLTVTDNSGYTASESVTVVIGMPIHETEPNDSAPDADYLPTVPFHNFLGDLGPTAPSGPGNEDWLRLRVTAPGLYHFNLGSIPVNGNVDIHLLDKDGRVVATANTPSADEMFSQSLASGEYYVKVLNRMINNNAEYALSMSADFTDLPVAVLEATPASGDFPLPAQLSAVGSYDPDGTIAGYEWDPYGDGYYDFNTGASNQLSFTYQRRGTFTARLRVTDNMGAVTIATRQVVVNGPPLDEIEPNDTGETAQVVSLPLSGFTGDCGYGGGYTNDQSNPHDYYRINALPGTGQLNLQLDFAAQTAQLRMSLYRLNMGNLVWLADSGQGMTPDQQVLGVLLATPGDYVVLVTAQTGSSEYSLNVEHQ